eukprot:16006475-Heterocapsa_arctica.AAC.1
MASPPTRHLESILVGSSNLATPAGSGARPVDCVNMALWSPLTRSNSSTRFGEAPKGERRTYRMFRKTCPGPSNLELWRNRWRGDLQRTVAMDLDDVARPEEL